MVILFILLLSNSFAQISQGGIPRYYDRDISIDFVEPNRMDLVDRNFNPMVFQFGDEYQMDIDILESVNPINDNGVYTYLFGIKSPGAYGIGIIFDDFYLSDNSTLFIYDQDQTMFLGSFTSNNNKDSFVFPTSVAKGDHIIIELNVPEDELDLVRLNIGTIIHDYEDIMGYFSESSGSNREDCNINVACPEGDNFEDQINGTIRVSMGGGLCSASIINNTLNDRTPYVLFADHCVSGSASGYVFLFNYQAATCTGTSAPENQSVSGSNLLVSEDINSGPDFALLEMTSTIPDSYNPFYVGWSRATLPPQGVFGVHHPGAGIKKITQNGTNVNGNGYYWEFQYNDGRVIPGSSGSPLFDSNKRQVGIASFIYTNYCDPSPDCYCDQQYTHGYGRFDSAMNMGLDTYLDPLNSGINGIDGISISGLSINHDPYEDMSFEDPAIMVDVYTNSASINFAANVTAYTGVIEAVELYYDIGDGFTALEMQQQGLGGYYSAMLDNIYNGMIIEYYIQAVNSEGIVQTFPSNAPSSSILFIIGDLPDFYSNDYEDGPGDWIIGDPLLDNASAGIWELAQPIATYNDQGNQVQPGEDHTVSGSYCFITGNGYEDGNGGFDDVDAGQTTLISPIFALASFDEVVLSYWYWYTNNIGDNGGNDLWRVLVSNNSGGNWQDLNVTSNSTNSWAKSRFILSDYLELTDEMQFKFIAEDLSYAGDNGSGGSLVEAALDDFLIEYISSNSGIVGDINSDDVVDVLDVVLVVNMVLGVTSPNYVLADINNDNAVNVQDIILLLNIILDN
tara:strand:+ start:15721 stop:18099 length:2379 start_codon:yes stop_codon:yes gene_type:complete